MNLSMFLKTVDGFTQDMSQVELRVLIHELARTLPEGKRDEFVNKLKAIKKAANANKSCKSLEKQSSEKFLDKLEQVKKQIAQIDEGELLLVGALNEEYDEWYNSSADEFLFEDPEGVLDIIDTSMDLIHKCVDQELYSEGYELAEMLSVLSVGVEGEYIDYCGDELVIYDLDRYGLLTGSFKQFVKDCLYLAYQGNKLSDRPDAVYCMMLNLECNDVALEDIMQNGVAELDQFDAFMELWIEYLGTCEERTAKKLILEAQSLLNDSKKALEIAKKYVTKHPALYEQYLTQSMGKGNAAEFFEEGWEALTKLPHKFVTRSCIALLTAENALQIQKFDEAEQCWLEAFRSETNCVNYLRICIESRDFSKYQKEITGIYTSVYEESRGKASYSLISGETAENKLNSAGYYTLLFLDGQFQKVIEKGMNVKAPLGWSATFMKQGMALFMLYLFDGEELTAGLKKMCDMMVGNSGFSAEKYDQGLSQKKSDGNMALFWKCFYKWKKNIVISEQERLTIMKKLENWIEFRVEGIMQANRRNYYNECAAFVAALGEVKESWGEYNGKDRIMNEYKTKYSRRRLFHQELRTMGLKR